jgi:hypothetical protein
MTINRFYASLIPPYLRLLRQIWQRQKVSAPPQQKPADQLYALALAVAEQYGLD